MSLDLIHLWHSMGWFAKGVVFVMATVYLAHDLKHDRRVAVKVISWTPRAPIFSTGTWPAIRHPGRSRTGGVGGACSIGATGC